MEKNFFDSNTELSLDRYIKQPNRFTLARFPQFSLMMHKVINAISLVLSKYVEQSYNEIDFSQMDFMEMDSKIISLDIPYKYVVQDPTHYCKVDEAILAIMRIEIKIPCTDKSGKDWNYHSNLFSVFMPDRRTKKFVIRMSKTVAREFIILDRGANGRKIYTKFLPAIPFNATCKYTAQIYRLLASWRSRNKIEYSLCELYEILDISGKYKRYIDFKNKVLKPVQKDLFMKGDVWFDCERQDFKKIKGGEVWLNFKLISNTVLEADQNKISSIMNMLRNYGVSEVELKKLKPIIYDNNIPKESIMYEITRVNELIYEKYTLVGLSLNNHSAYLVKSLVNFAKTFKKRNQT